jgi:hypothetical protein
MSIANLAVVCVAVQLFMAAVLATGEATGRLRLPYSKFGAGVGVNSRAGLALAYATPIFVYIAVWIEGGAPQTPYHLAVLAAFLFHFVRRFLEILFVNSYSRPTPLCALVIIALLYAGAATSCAFFQVHTLGQPTSNPIHARGSRLCLRRTVERIPPLAFGPASPAGRAHIRRAARRLVWLGGQSALFW